MMFSVLNPGLICVDCMFLMFHIFFAFKQVMGTTNFCQSILYFIDMSVDISGVIVLWWILTIRLQT